MDGSSLDERLRPRSRSPSLSSLTSGLGCALTKGTTDSVVVDVAFLDRDGTEGSEVS